MTNPHPTVMFHRVWPRWQANEALESENHPELGRFAHTLKSTLLQCGLNELAAKAEKIYLGTRTHSNLSHERLLEQLNSSLAGLVDNEHKNIETR